MRTLAEPLETRPRERLFRALLVLALPVLAENALNLVVQLNDTYLANHLDPGIRVDATAAMGTVVYLMWFIGLFAGAVGAGATAIIARATGARHLTRAHAACGQAILLAAVLGACLVAIFYFGAPFIAHISGLADRPARYATDFLRLFAIFTPAMLLLMVANACLRGAGDTRTPLLAMIVVNVVNVALTWSFVHGLFFFPQLGFNGIALGTGIAYCVGAAMQITVLIHGIGKLRLRLHRLRLHTREMARVLRIGLPAAVEQSLMWGANFYLVYVVNKIGPVASAAHLNAVRLESLSFTTGFAVGIATATMVGQSLGMRDIARARKVAHYGMLLGGGVMTTLGLLFIFLAQPLAQWMSADAAVIDLTAQCLFIAGFIQIGFAAYIVFASALRGAGDTRGAMYVNLFSVVGIRLGGVAFFGQYLGVGLAAIWIVLCTELMIRGALMYARFLQGRWMVAKV
jgi:putative MATE family efflux protein